MVDHNNLIDTRNLVLFTLIVPIYNTSEQYLCTCMDSLLQQTYGNIEIILVDDGSADECAIRCDSYAKEDKRVRVIHQQNQGVSVARNAGIDAASGKWILFVDADDWLEYHTCERIKDYLERQSCDILLFNAIREYAEGMQKNMKYGFDHKRLYDTNDVSVKEMLYRRGMGNPNTREGRLCNVYYCWDKVYSREFLHTNKLRFPVGIPKSEDKIFILSCFEKLQTLYYVEDVFYHYRLNLASVCHKYGEHADQDRMKMAKYLSVIATRMDAELERLTNGQKHGVIYNEYLHFIFGIISDVLLLKYYHEDYPNGKRIRNAEVRRFLHTDPFCEALHRCKYRDLPNNAKAKKFLLSLGLVSLFCYMKGKSERKIGLVAE